VNHRWIARGLVVGLHVALLAALWLHQPARRDDTRDRRLTTVRLLQPKPRRTPPPASQAIAPPRTQAPALPDVAPPAFTTEPAPTAINSPAPPPSSEAPPAEPPRTALRLTLPPGYAASSAAARNPALSDPRSNTPRPTLEDRIADATGGTGAWVEEPVDNHAQSVGALGEYRTVLRKGNTCTEVFRSRISDSDPFNNSVAPRTVAMQGRAYKCK
jgi:hypothetical protein